MGDKSKIEWTEATWNPVTGCNKISEGCRNCYAEVMANGVYCTTCDDTMNPDDDDFKRHYVHVTAR